jgi:hypothetical protein
MSLSQNMEEREMKHGNGKKDLVDKSIGIEILMSDVFVKINPTDPLRLTKQVARRKTKLIRFLQ